MGTYSVVPEKKSPARGTPGLFLSFPCKWESGARGFILDSHFRGNDKVYYYQKGEGSEGDSFRIFAAMHIITRKRLNDFADKYPEMKSGLVGWYREVKSRNFDSFSQLRAVFPTADKVGKLTVFNIGGNKARLVAAIHYNRKRIYIRAVLTHTEYDEGKWKE